MSKYLIPKKELEETRKIFAKPTHELFEYVFNLIDESGYGDVESACYVEALKKRFGFKYRIPNSGTMQDFIEWGYVEAEGKKDLVVAKV